MWQWPLDSKNKVWLQKYQTYFSRQYADKNRFTKEGYITVENKATRQRQNGVIKNNTHYRYYDRPIIQMKIIHKLRMLKHSVVILIRETDNKDTNNRQTDGTKQRFNRRHDHQPQDYQETTVTDSNRDRQQYRQRQNTQTTLRNNQY